MPALCPLSLTPLLDGAERLLVGAKIFVFDSGTLTPRLAYTKADLTAQHPRPIVVGSSGRIPQIWTTGGDYRLIITSADGVGVDDVDGIPGDVSSSGSGGGGGGGTDLRTGDVLWSQDTAPRANFVRANGRTIGSDVSGATERANADCQPLFLHNWDKNPYLAVSGGRGASAAADWAANKTIALPDARLGALFGLDDMGNSPAGRAAGLTFSNGNATTAGSTGGSATVTLSTTQMPSHTHTGTTDGQGSHQHSGSTYGVSDHAHGASSDAQGDHTHNVSYDKITVGGGGGGQVVSDISGSGRANNVGTGNGGLHAHNIFVNGAGAHAHGFVTDAAGYHAHVVATAAAGGGAAHSNMPNFILGTLYMRL